MSALARPGVHASILAAGAVVLHPALGLSRPTSAHAAALAALLLLAVAGLAARAASARERRAGAALAAAGAVILVAALAVDGVRGHHGTLALAPGQLQGNFDERAPGGRALGLRPLGFTIGAERVSTAGGSSAPRVALLLPGRRVPVDLTPDRAIAFGGYRFARPAASTTGRAARLRVAASDGAATEVADVAPGAPGRAFGLTIALEEYFPDFALDGARRPFSRSAEPRNPAALLTVQKGGEGHRVFVLQSMPGIHRVLDLGLAFSLLGVEPERTVAIDVHREPAAPAALAGALLLAAGVALVLRLGPAAVSADRDGAVAVAGAGLVALLLLADRGAVLAWTFAVPAEGGRVALPGVGVLLGAGLVAALGGTLLLVAGRLAGTAAGVAPAGRGALWVAVASTTAALLLGVVRVSGHAAGREAVLPLGALAVAVFWLAASLLVSRAGAPPLPARLVPLALPLAVLAALAVAVTASVSGVLRDGTYATSSAAASASAALLGLAALEPTRAAGVRRLALLVSLLALAVT
jgi:hypothetical protein